MNQIPTLNYFLVATVKTSQNYMSLQRLSLWVRSSLTIQMKAMKQYLPVEQIYYTLQGDSYYSKLKYQEKILDHHLLSTNAYI